MRFRMIFSGSALAIGLLASAHAATPAGLGPTAAPGATAPANGEEVAVLKTNLGDIVLKFFPKLAPNHVLNFKTLARIKFYDGTKFHRVIPNFMIQGGDSNSKGPNRQTHGQGGPCFAKIPPQVASVKKAKVRADFNNPALQCYEIPSEFNGTPHTRGILSMARANDPNSAGSQFFITVAAANFLDRQYTAFGQVVRGMDVADRIVALQRDRADNPLPQNPAVIKAVVITKWPVK